MAEEANALAAQPAPSAAPNAEVTATPAAAPVSGENQPAATPNEQQPAKTFTQAELDRIVAQRLARQERQFLREQQQRIEAQQPQPQPDQSSGRPKPADFSSTEDYIEAVSDWKAKQVFEQTLQQNEARVREARQRDFEANLDSQYREREAKAAVVYPDYDATVYENPNVVYTTPMALAIKQLPNGADIAYHLGKNPQDSQRIARMHPLAQAAEIGMIGQRLLATAPSAPAQSSAPQPIPAGRPNSTLPAFDTTDPRSTSMGASEWIARERARQAAKLSGANR